MDFMDQNMEYTQKWQQSRSDVERYDHRIDKGMKFKANDESSILFKLLKLQSAWKLILKHLMVTY